MAALIFIFANIIILASSQTKCPSSKWIYCASESGRCSIPGSIKEGYMSYGTDGKWSLTPFSNSGSASISIYCKGGDPQWGKTKYCCYMAADIGINVDLPSKTEGVNPTKHSEGDDYLFYEGPRLFRRGVDNQWVYRVSQDAWTHCTSSFAGDISNHGTERCEGWAGVFPDSVPEISSTEWVLCGNENHDCTGLDTRAPQWIRYGTDGNGMGSHHYYFRLIISHDGKIKCNDALFNNPIDMVADFPKHCYRATNPYSFPGIAGEWELLTSCHGCEIEYQYSVGVTNMESSEITNSWSSSLSMGVSAGFSFGPISGGGDVSKEKSEEVSKSMTKAFEKTASETVTYECEKDNLYQWTLSSTSKTLVSAKDFKVKGNSLACIDSGYKPKCLPNHCGGDNCQTCI